jgi:hypothetical protein
VGTIVNTRLATSFAHQHWRMHHVSGDGIHWAAIFTSVGAIVGMLAIVFAAVGTFYAGRQLAAATAQRLAEEQTRQATTLIEVCRRWDDATFLDARYLTQQYRDPEQLHRMMRKWSDENSKQFFQALREPNFFEDLAILAKHNAITTDALRDLFQSAIVETFDHWKPTIEAWQSAQPTNFENFERLAGLMRQPAGTAPASARLQ